MIFPKFILLSGTFTGLSGYNRLIAKKGEVSVPKTDFPGNDILIVNLAPRASGKRAAIGSLEVAKFNDRDRCIGIAKKVLGIANHEIHEGSLGRRVRRHICRG